jgi:hypothetical protein
MLLQALDALLSFMDSAGGLFGAICPNVEVDPPIRYNGSNSKKKQLEDLYERYTATAIMAGK